MRLVDAARMVLTLVLVALILYADRYGIGQRIEITCPDQAITQMQYDCEVDSRGVWVTIPDWDEMSYHARCVLDHKPVEQPKEK